MDGSILQDFFFLLSYYVIPLFQLWALLGVSFWEDGFNKLVTLNNSDTLLSSLALLVK